MEWIRSHPYGTTLCSVGLMIFIGGIFVYLRLQTVPLLVNGSFNTETLAFDPTIQARSIQAPKDTASILNQVLDSGTAYPAIHITSTSTQPSATISNDTTPIDLATLERELNLGTHSNGKQSATNTSNNLIDPFSFIPSGLISTTSTTKEKTPVQQALFEYGNEAGGYIQSYDSLHQNQASILKDQLSDRTSGDKGAAVKTIGDDLASVGRHLAKVDNVPPEIRAANLSLAQSYQDIGEKLSKVPDAQYDPDLISAIKTYDKSVESFNTKYIAIVMVFRANGVIFAPSDPGSVFSFSGASL